MKLNQYKCLTCNKVHDFATHAPLDPDKSETILDVAKQALKHLEKSVKERTSEEFKPKPGDLSVCSGCGTVSLFQEDGDIRALTAEELVELYGIDENAYFMVMKMSQFIKSSLGQMLSKRSHDRRTTTSEDQGAGGT